MKLQSINEWKEESDYQIDEAKKDIWNGRLTNVDKILTYHYNEMNKGDQEIKDKLFFAYYRYFNDGDVIKFPVGILKKVGCDSETINSLENAATVKSAKKRAMKFHDTNRNFDWYNKAMDKAISATISYFGKKYPKMFSEEGRQKTIGKWKEEVLNYANRKGYETENTEMDKYWVSEFGTHFGIPELSAYNPYKPENKDKPRTITDKEEKEKILALMNKSINGGKDADTSNIGQPVTIKDKNSEFFGHSGKVVGHHGSWTLVMMNGKPHSFRSGDFQ